MNKTADERIHDLEQRSANLEALAKSALKSLEVMCGAVVGQDAVIKALTAEQGAHGHQILRLFAAFAELSSALAQGKEPPAAPTPEQGCRDSVEIDELNRLMRQDDPPSEAA